MDTELKPKQRDVELTRFKIHSEGKRVILFIQNDERLWNILDTYAKEELGIHATPTKSDGYPIDFYSQTLEADGYEFTGKEDLLLEFLAKYFDKPKRGRPTLADKPTKPTKQRGRPRKQAA